MRMHHTNSQAKVFFGTNLVAETISSLIHVPAASASSAAKALTQVSIRAALVLEGGREADGAFRPALEGSSRPPHVVQLFSC